MVSTHAEGFSFICRRWQHSRHFNMKHDMTLLLPKYIWDCIYFNCFPLDIVAAARQILPKTTRMKSKVATPAVM